MARYLSPIVLVASASLGLLVGATAPQSSCPFIADLRRDSGRCTASDPAACRATATEDDADAEASFMQLKKKAAAVAEGRRSAGTLEEQMAHSDLITCFQRDCNKPTFTPVDVAACAVCLQPFQGSHGATISSVKEELTRSGLTVVGKTNPYVNNIPDACFTAKGKNSGSPLGYTHLCKGDMAHSKDVHGDECYGPNSVCLTSWQAVMDWAPQIPEGQWNGTLWRGQELGTSFLSPYMWSASGINPFTALGMLPSQHYAVRPGQEKAFGPGPKNSVEYQQTEEMIRLQVKQFLEEMKQTGMLIDFPGPITVFVYQVLYRHVFKKECSKETAEAFVLLQLMVLGSALQEEDASMLAKVPGLYPEIAIERGRLVESYEPMVEALYGDLIEGEDCSPSKSCLTQLASTILDGFMLAGGVSMTFTLNTGVSLLFSTAEPSGTPFSGHEEVQNPPEAWKKWGNPFPQRAYEPGQELQYYWEVLRYFAPVGSAASWKVAPTCSGETAAQTAARFKPHGRSEPCELGPDDPATGIPKINQFTGGDGHVYPSLPVAQRDPRRWGPDANEFKIRPLEDYKWSVGFLEPAVNNKIANGRMNRVCPGKTLALMLGAIFFEEFNKEDWAPLRIASNITFTQDSKPSSQNTMPFAPSFTLSSKAMVEACNEVCPPSSFAKEAEECETAKAECKCAKCKADGALSPLARLSALIRGRSCCPGRRTRRS